MAGIVDVSDRILEFGNCEAKLRMQSGDGASPRSDAYGLRDPMHAFGVKFFLLILRFLPHASGFGAGPEVFISFGFDQGNPITPE